MLTVHHLGKSQSERIVWLCEELAIAYELKRYARDAATGLAPAEYKALHPLGTAPVITDGTLVLAESGAIVDYLVARHGGGRLVLGPAHPSFADYLFWFHFSNANLQPAMGRSMVLRRLDLASDHPILLAMQARLERSLAVLEARLSDAAYLAGPEFTAADVMTVFSLTTMRLYYPLDLAPYPGIRAYLQRIGGRPAYQSAMRKGDPDMAPMLS